MKTSTRTDPRTFSTSGFRFLLFGTLLLGIALFAGTQRAHAAEDIDQEVVKNFELFDKMNIVENLELAANYDFLAEEDND